MFEEVREAFELARKKGKYITFLVGAGLSAESGIPTFRGFDGYWTVGSDNYPPEEMGTFAMFQENPEAVWNWFLYRAGICNNAEPNEGHYTLTKFESLLDDQFALISQNVDGLHFRAGSSELQTYLIHGDLRYMRCAAECSSNLYEIPEGLAHGQKDYVLSPAEHEMLKCPYCGSLTRPHVLWFDESYDEENYSLNTVLDIAEETGLMFVIGTQGTTTLPWALYDTAKRAKAFIVNIDPYPNKFSFDIERKNVGVFLKGASGEILPKLFEHLDRVPT